MILYPQQSVQQKTEYLSLAILGYALKDFGILRNVATNDFGIDLEIDVVTDGSVSGRIIKAQVKASQAISPKADGSVSVDGIKQSTLAYWMNVSRSCPVIVFAVDVGSEAIYFSEPIHKQAAALIDGTRSTKTVHLSRRLSHGKRLRQTYEAFAQEVLSGADFGKHAQESAQILVALKQKLDARLSQDQIFFAYLDELSRDANLREEAHLHGRCLQHIETLFALQDDWANHHLDRGTEISEPELFRFFLRAARILIGYWPLVDYCRDEQLDLARIYDARYWEERSKQALQAEGFSVGITYEGTRRHIPRIVNLLLRHLVARREAMTTDEAHYWSLEDPDYLRQVFGCEISLAAPGGKHAVRDHLADYRGFLDRTRQDTARRVAEDAQRREEKKSRNSATGDPA